MAFIVRLLIILLDFILGISSLLSVDRAYFSESGTVDEARFMDLYLQLNVGEIATLAHQAKDMIKTCRINTEGGIKKCMALQTGAKTLFTPTHGVCYAFNIVQESKINTTLSIANIGPKNGLILRMNLEGLK